MLSHCYQSGGKRRHRRELPKSVVIPGLAAARSSLLKKGAFLALIAVY
jgi:hypothetical protein